ncbi:Translin-associated factor TraX [Trichophyton interdigitale]|uniref:Translin-associated factor TraX n=1 Tax=Trichophyton interdigitale TaxID=101480 RepID=A0A9P4YHX6_9EURO|nr:Translin-associated factor TraX [Trichophyton interdigitale]KAF3896563.1 Translin-associated factor TraX [Trichophyton interdigitale]KAG8208776.1 Translin-associated factor TraX [Trichophyton interdigitale]
MAGNKRAWDGNVIASPLETENMDTSPGASSIQSIFTEFRNELDEHHDRRERVVKASRDITALSKKIVRTVNAPIPPKIAKETDDRIKQIQELFKSIEADVSGANAFRYHQITWGIQEYIEAISFHRYLEKKQLITLEEVSQTLPAGIKVTEAEYVLGLYDLTGEMMRFAITTMTTGRTASVKEGDVTSQDKSQQPEGPMGGDAVLSDLRQLRAMFEQLNVPRGLNGWKEVDKKLEVMQTSVEKVERAVYGLLVRGTERPSGWVPDLSSAAAVESH